MSRSNCKLCGDRTARSGDLCEAHYSEFLSWHYRMESRGYSFQESENSWLAGVLMRLSKNDLGIHRCESIVGVSRCHRFAIKQVKKHHVCGLCAPAILRKKNARFDTSRLVTLPNLEAALKAIDL